VDLEVRTKGFAIVPAAPMTPRSSTAPDAAERERFESILSFKRRREARSGRVIGAAGVVMVALILSPPLTSLPDRVAGDAPPSSDVTKFGPSEPGNRLGAIHPSGAGRAPIVSGPSSNAPVPGVASRAFSKPPAVRATGA
jgi:hypothetical protein